MPHLERLVLGLVPSDRLRERDPRTRAFARALAERSGIYVVERAVSSYDDLARDMTMARIDVAWLPPMVFARLERDQVAVALASRAKRSLTYASVLVAAARSDIRSLADVPKKRIAWVDPLSASGYVVPRLGLMARGLDPHGLFANELFAGSHAEAIRAVMAGRADVAAVFAHADQEGRILRGAWSEIGVDPSAVRVIATLGEVPPDVIAARTSVPAAAAEAITRAILEMADDPKLGPIVEGVFGERHFERGASASYLALRELLDQAAHEGMGGATEAFVSTAPPSRSAT